MPLPKDPIKAAAYRKRMSEALKLKWATDTNYAARVAKGHTGRVASEATIEKQRQAQLKLCADPEERKRRSERAKQLGYGKWMKGRDTKHYKRPSRKGKTYEEIYGLERATEERQKRVEANRIAKLGKDHSHLLEAGKVIAAKRKGKSYEDIYGDAADNELRKRSDAHLKRWKDKPKKNDVRPKHNGDHCYKEWRTTVFKRDGFTCRDCGQRGQQLHAHHIKAWAKHPELRYEVSNGITLCVACHKAHHSRKASA